MTEYPHLLAPGTIGPLALRNRILMAPMGDGLANPDGTVSDAQLAYFEARARGGAALLLVGSVAVAYPDGCVDDRQVAASRPSDVPGLTELAARVHRHGAAVAAQLVYNGALARQDIARGHPMLVPAVPPRPAPDRLSMMVTDEELAGFMAPYAHPTSKVEYRVATDEDLARVVQQFADAAARCREAGVDGVEIHAGHGYLLDEFLSPASNPRTDAWGGDVEGRARLLVEVVRAIRGRVGADYPVWMRVNALEHHKEHGEQPDDQLRVMELAVAAGLDAVHVTAYASMDVATGPTDSYAPHRVGDLAAHAARARARLAVPVITFGRFEPDEAEAVLAAGAADFVAFGRKLLADPDLPARLAAGAPERVRPCLYQYRCIGNIFVNRPLACVANAATGREHEAVVAPPARPRRAVVIGAGPAGLEAARALADAGHDVEVLEARDSPGGVLATIAGADTVLDRYRAWLALEVADRGVGVHLGVAVAADDERLAGADVVVVATGPRWTRPEVAGGARARTPEQLGDVWDGSHPATTVALLGGGKPSLTLAAALVERGHTVTVVEPGTVLGTELGLPGRWRAVADLEAAGATLLTGATVDEVGPDTVTVRVDGEPRVVPATLVVTTTRVAGAPALADALRTAGHRVVTVGDAQAPRGFEGLTRDAEDLVRLLSA